MAKEPAIQSATTVSAAVAPTIAVRRAASVRKVNFRVLPGLVQPGRKARPAGKARHVGDIRVRPKRAKVRVRVQVSTPRGWKVVAQRRTNAQGEVQVTLPARRNGSPATYRVRAGKAISPERSTKKWVKPSFGDNFNGKRLGKAWTHRMQVYNPSGLRACSKGSPRAAKVSDGALRLSVLRDRSRGKNRCWAMKNGKREGPYAYRLNGHVSTENSYSFKYGYAAARIKFQRNRGQHGSFWLQPLSHSGRGYGPRHTGAEIDVVEWFGLGGSGSRLSQFTYHKTPRGKTVKTGGLLNRPQRFLSGPKDTWFGRYHVFSLEWTPKEYIFRIDGKVSWRSRKGISHRPQFLILSLLSSDYEIARSGDRGLGTQHMDVDWLRVWETGR